MGEWAVARVQGVLGSWELPFRSWLAAQGYAPTTVVDVVWQLDGLSRWLGCERLTLGELTPERVEQFVAARLAAGYTKRWSRCVLPIRFLREVGAVPAIPVPAPADGAVERLLVEYRKYLAWERGLAAGTIANYTRDARVFLTDCEQRGLALDGLTAGDVSRFLVRECPKRGAVKERGSSRQVA